MPLCSLYIYLINVSVSKAQPFPLNKQSADFITGLFFPPLFLLQCFKSCSGKRLRRERLRVTSCRAFAPARLGRAVGTGEQRAAGGNWTGCVQSDAKSSALPGSSRSGEKSKAIDVLSG